MREAEVNAELCDGCQDCIEVCRYDAIHLVRRTLKRMVAQVDSETCCGCLECEGACPQHGIVLHWLGYREPGWARSGVGTRVLRSI